jgi:hypothetical protein
MYGVYPSTPSNQANHSVSKALALTALLYLLMVKICISEVWGRDIFTLSLLLLYAPMARSRKLLLKLLWSTEVKKASPMAMKPILMDTSIMVMLSKTPSAFTTPPMELMRCL